jgi:hypothetical protein
MKQLFFILLVLNYFSSFGQIACNTGSLNRRNLYYQSLIQLYKSENPDKNTVVDTIYVIEKHEITDSLLSLCNLSTRFVVSVLKSSDIQKKAAIDTNFIILQFSSLEYKNGYFYIPLKKIWIVSSKETQEIEYRVLDCSKFEFYFSRKRFIYKKKLVCLN